jgi:hypothetical protein
MATLRIRGGMPPFSHCDAWHGTQLTKGTNLSSPVKALANEWQTLGRFQASGFINLFRYSYVGDPPR